MSAPMSQVKAWDKSGEQAHREAVSDLESEQSRQPPLTPHICLDWICKGHPHAIANMGLGLFSVAVTKYPRLGDP